jgi:hypothetical protein
MHLQMAPPKDFQVQCKVDVVAAHYHLEFLSSIISNSGCRWTPGINPIPIARRIAFAIFL